MLRILRVGIATDLGGGEDVLVHDEDSLAAAIGHLASGKGVPVDLIVLDVPFSQAELKALRRVAPLARLVSTSDDATVDRVVAPAGLVWAVEEELAELRADRFAGELLRAYGDRTMEAVELLAAEAELASAPEVVLSTEERRRSLESIRSRLPRPSRTARHPDSARRPSRPRFRRAPLLAVAAALMALTGLWWSQARHEAPPERPARTAVPSQIRLAVPGLVRMMEALPSSREASDEARSTRAVPTELPTRLDQSPEVQELAGPVLDWLEGEYDRIETESDAAEFVDVALDWLTASDGSSRKSPPIRLAERQIVTAMIADIASRFALFSSTQAQVLLDVSVESDDPFTIIEALWAAAYVYDDADWQRRAVAPFLLDEHETVRAAAANILAVDGIASPTLAPSFRSALMAFPSDLQLCAQALGLFHSWQDHSADDLFVHLLDSPDVSLRLATARHFLDQGDPRAVEVLDRLARSAEIAPMLRSLATTTLLRRQHSAGDALCLDLLTPESEVALENEGDRLLLVNGILRHSERAIPLEAARNALSQDLHSDSTAEAVLRKCISMSGQSVEIREEIGLFLSGAPHLQRLYEIADQQSLGAEAAEVAGTLIDLYDLR